jgi:hypothetical protein
MKIKTFCFFLVISHTISFATLIKGKAKVYTIESHIPFAVLYDSAYVMQSYDSQRDKIWINYYCFIKKADYRNGKLVTRTIQFDYDGKGLKKWPVDKIFMTDTIYLYADSNLQKIIGYAWPATDSVTISFQDDFRYKSPNYFQCWLYGHVDSSSIKEFEPWNNIIRKINKENMLFSTSFAKLNGIMLLIHNYCTPITGKGVEYSETYDEETPEPNKPLIYVFQNGILKAIWCEIKLNIKNKEKYHGGNLYYDDSIKSLLPKIKKNIKATLDYRS